MKMVKGFDDLKVNYKISYDAIDGCHYEKEVQAKNEYEAMSMVSSEVNNGKNFGYNFKAKFSGF